VLDFIKWIKYNVLGGDLTTSTMPGGYPNPTQFWFSTRCKPKPLFTRLADVWYIVDPQGRRINIMPSNEFLYFTGVALAFLIMSDGYWDNDQKTVLICTENFTP
jgi:hypothetical protein